MRTALVAAELVDTRQILPEEWLLAFRAPELVSGARAGQFVHLRTLELSGLPRRRPVPINTADPVTGMLTLHVRAARRGIDPLVRLRPGETLEMIGPLGRPFEVDPRSRHLLLVAGGLGIAGLRFLVDEAIRDGRHVVLLFGAASARNVYPSSLLPDEVEYAVATDDGSLGHRGPVTDLVQSYEAWADQAFACGQTEMLGNLAALAAGRRERLGVAALGRKRGAGKPLASGSPAARRKSFLQVAVGQEIGCATAACLGCVVFGASGQPLRACREGPVFGAGELAWEAS